MDPNNRIDLTVLHALATAATAPSLEVDANTPDAELDAFLFGGREMLVTDETTDAELSAFIRGKRIR